MAKRKLLLLHRGVELGEHTVLRIVGLGSEGKGKELLCKALVKVFGGRKVADQVNRVFELRRHIAKAHQFARCVDVHTLFYATITPQRIEDLKGRTRWIDQTMAR